MSNDIDGILEKLQKTLNRKDGEEISSRNVESNSKEIDGNSSINLEIDSNLREKILTFFNKELQNKFGDFFSTDAGSAFLERSVASFLEKNNAFIEKIIKIEINNRIRNIKL